MNRRLQRALILILILILVQVACLGSASSDEAPKSAETPAGGAAVVAPIGAASPTSAPALAPTLPPAQPTQPPAQPAAGEAGDWLVILYQNADDQPLEGGGHMDLNEAEMAGPSDRVTIVSQFDRFAGGFEGDGGWSSTRRYRVQPGVNLDVIESELVADLGELDSGDTQTLIDFAVWAIQTHPSDHYVLVLSNHGGGWTGGWSDNDPVQGSSMTMDEIDQAIGEIVRQSGILSFELLVFDACLMAQLESLSAVAPYTRYAIASEENVPSIGLGYHLPLTALKANPEMSGADLARAFVEAYIVKDAFLQDPLNRMMISIVRGLAPESSPEQLAATYDNVTMAAYDMASLPELTGSLNDLVVALQGADQTLVAQARSYAQSFSSVFGDDVPQSFIDLGHWASLLDETLPDDPQIQARLDGVLAALQKTVIAEKHAALRPGSTGISIFFPNSRLFEFTFSPESPANYESYTRRFSAASLWDDFLRFHYTGKAIDPSGADLSLIVPPSAAAPEPAPTPEPVTPEQTGEVTAPGAGMVTISPITLSAESIKNTESAFLTTQVEGPNLAYLYDYVFWLDEQSGDFQTVDVDFLTAEATREVNGVVFPDWGGESFELEFEWEPNIYYISNGSEEIFAVIEPETYAADTTQNTYLVNGYFTDSEVGEERRSVIRFNGDGTLNSIWVYTNEDGSGTPSEISPTAGDSFTVLHYWLEYDNNPDGEIIEYAGDAITFGDTPLTWTGYPPIGGTYLVGIGAEDLDGNMYYEFVAIEVTE